MWCRISFAWISMSAAWPCAPPSGWWIMIRELGSEYRLPCAPEASRNAPIDAARPTQTVETSGRMKRIVSKTAIPAVTEPPGLLTYTEMSDWKRGGFGGFVGLRARSSRGKAFFFPLRLAALSSSLPHSILSFSPIILPSRKHPGTKAAPRPGWPCRRPRGRPGARCAAGTG